MEKGIKYYLVHIFVVVTEPIRKLLSYFGVKGLLNTQVAARFYFKHDYPVQVINNQMALESGKFTSQKSTLYHNHTGMGRTKNSPYQNGATLLGSGKFIEPTFATYPNDTACVADLYHWYYKRSPSAGVTLDSYKQIPIPVIGRTHANQNKAIATGGEFSTYAQKVALKLYSVGYYQSDPVAYADNLDADHAYSSSVGIYFLIGMFLVWSCALGVVIWLVYLWLTRYRKSSRK